MKPTRSFVLVLDLEVLWHLTIEPECDRHPSILPAALDDIILKDILMKMVIHIFTDASMISIFQHDDISTKAPTPWLLSSMMHITTACPPAATKIYTLTQASQRLSDHTTYFWVHPNTSSRRPLQSPRDATCSSSHTRNIYLLRKYQLNANSLTVSPHGDGTSALPALATGCLR